MKLKSMFLILFAMSMSNVQSMHRDPMYRRRLIARHVLLHRLHQPRRVAVIRRMTPLARHRVLIAHRILDRFAKINVDHTFNNRNITTTIQLGRRPAHLFRGGRRIQKQRIAVNGFKTNILYAKDRLTIIVRNRVMVIICRDYRGKLHKITTRLPRPIGNIGRLCGNVKINTLGNTIQITMPR